MPVVARTAEQQVRELQHTVYRAAKAEPGRRFHALYDKVHRRGVLERAWGQVRRNRGAAGIDGVTIAEVERYGVDRLLDELAAELESGSYRVQPSPAMGGGDGYLVFRVDTAQPVDGGRGGTDL